MSASVNNSHSGRGVVPLAVAAPWAMAQALPAQPGGRGWPAMTRRLELGGGGRVGQERGAGPAVPSVLLSSTSTT